jgi:hypothetical protein
MILSFCRTRREELREESLRWREDGGANWPASWFGDALLLKLAEKGVSHVV